MDEGNVFTTARFNNIHDLRSLSNEIALTGGMAWSPDGNKIAYVTKSETARFGKNARPIYQLKLHIVDVITRKSTSIPCMEMQEPKSTHEMINWLDTEHLNLMQRQLAAPGKARQSSDLRLVGGYRFTGNELVKLASPHGELDSGQLVNWRTLSDGTWFVRARIAPSELEQRVLNMLTQSKIRWITSLADAYQRNLSTRFSRLTRDGEASHPRLLASVVINNAGEFKLTEDERYLVVSSLLPPANDQGRTELRLRRQQLAVCNFAPAFLPTWLFQFIVAVLAFASLLIVSTLLSWLCSIVSRRVFRQRTT